MRAVVIVARALEASADLAVVTAMPAGSVDRATPVASAVAMVSAGSAAETAMDSAAVAGPEAKALASAVARAMALVGRRTKRVTGLGQAWGDSSARRCARASLLYAGLAGKNSVGVLCSAYR